MLGWAERTVQNMVAERTRRRWTAEAFMGISFNERIGLYIELQYYRPTLTKMQLMRAVEAEIVPTILGNRKFTERLHDSVILITAWQWDAVAQ